MFPTVDRIIELWSPTMPGELTNTPSQKGSQVKTMMMLVKLMMMMMVLPVARCKAREIKEQNSASGWPEQKPNSTRLDSTLGCGNELKRNARQTTKRSRTRSHSQRRRRRRRSRRDKHRQQIEATEDAAHTWCSQPSERGKSWSLWARMNALLNIYSGTSHSFAAVTNFLVKQKERV